VIGWLLLQTIHSAKLLVFCLIKLMRIWLFPLVKQQCENTQMTLSLVSNLVALIIKLKMSELQLINSEKVAERGYASAQYNFGVMYEYGQGVSQDYGKALIWYRKAARQGDEMAKNKLAQLASIDPDAKRDLNDVAAQGFLAAKSFCRTS